MAGPENEKLAVETPAPNSGAALEAHRSYLYRYALIRLQDPELARDAVQETLMAAVAGLDRFEGRSSPRSWLTGILKHKIADCLRHYAKTVSISCEEEEAEDPDLEALFRSNGHWNDPPRAWGDPEQSLERQEFWEILDRCCRELPPKTAQAFLLREVMGESVEAICNELQISATHCSVMLYRARLRLRLCLESRWFSP